MGVRADDAIVLGDGWCGPRGEGAVGAPLAPEVTSASWVRDVDVFTNHGAYMPRVHCMTTASGEPDWFWIGLLVALTLGVVGWYARIYTFWRQSYFAERAEDRNPRMMELANIFLWCAVCGYGMSVLMFVWPAYRLLAIFLIVLNIWSWRFVLKIGDFRSALQAKRFERELRESLETRNADLEREVAARTAELDEARRVAEEASAAKTSFLANVSHEIRTPLNSILGFAQVLADDDADATRRAEHLETISRNGEHLLSVVSDVLDLSKIEAGSLEVERIETNVGELLRDVGAIMSERAASKGLELRIEVDSAGVAERITSDPTRLRQILLNLAGNAIKFTSSGSVVVRASDVGARVMRFEVIDTGIGIAPEQAERIFEPFAQGDGTTTRRFGGTGLGLAISRRLAERPGGSLVAAGNEGAGSTFTLTIDAGDASGRLTGIGDACAVGVGRHREVELGMRVLLAEDGVDNRRLIEHMLARAGVTLVCVEDGLMAVEELASARASGERYDAVLMDMQMPVMDGLSATRELREAGDATPVIALTANALASDREACLLAGCDGFLAKPVRRGDLIDALRTHGERGRRAA